MVQEDTAAIADLMMELGDSPVGAWNTPIGVAEARETLAGLPRQYLDRQPERICDAGCGSGLLLMDVAEEYPDAEVTGVDLSPASIDAAEERAAASDHVDQADVRQADVYAFLPGTEDFDAIYAISILPDVQDPARFLRCMYDNLREGGQLYLTFPPEAAAEPYSMYKEMDDETGLPYLEAEDVEAADGADFRQYVFPADRFEEMYTAAGLTYVGEEQVPVDTDGHVAAVDAFWDDAELTERTRERVAEKTPELPVYVLER